MVGIVLVCTAWGHNMGGINSINYGMTKALGLLNADDKNLEIYCIVTDKINMPDAEMINKVKELYGVELIGLKEPQRSSTIQKIFSST